MKETNLTASMANAAKENYELLKLRSRVKEDGRDEERNNLVGHDSSADEDY